MASRGIRRCTGLGTASTRSGSEDAQVVAVEFGMQTPRERERVQYSARKSAHAAFGFVVKESHVERWLCATRTASPTKVR